jgi:hypothetical protein
MSLSSRSSLNKGFCDMIDRMETAKKASEHLRERAATMAQSINNLSCTEFQVFARFLRDAFFAAKSTE